ncbi:hypothetical protein AAFF_G00046300 [Aldrovandia affinis]|uniref:Uncharacterized protein n=1 Tax=Aldrovandia affinis TaxID=143900 RepID=A0AAD7S1U0_9TELE|nr:hypothetical protein AAFF_G00046300 [Aldrovandia affinis]
MSQTFIEKGNSGAPRLNESVKALRPAPRGTEPGLSCSDTLGHTARLRNNYKVCSEEQPGALQQCGESRLNPKNRFSSFPQEECAVSALHTALFSSLCLHSAHGPILLAPSERAVPVLCMRPDSIRCACSLHTARFSSYPHKQCYTCALRSCRPSPVLAPDRSAVSLW